MFRKEVIDALSGSRDQLYLALRIATLEQHLKKGEPMPFVVDDILIGFDDNRTRVCLEVLAELSTSIQYFFSPTIDGCWSWQIAVMKSLKFSNTNSLDELIMFLCVWRKTFNINNPNQADKTAYLGMLTLPHRSSEYPTSSST